MKADFARYFALALFGGVWFDSDCECLVPVDDWEPTPTHPDVMVGKELMPGRRKQICNWCMAAQPESELMRATVRQVCDNLLSTPGEELIGMDAEERVYFLTGPRALTLAADRVGVRPVPIHRLGLTTGSILANSLLPSLLFECAGGYVRHYFHGSWKPASTKRGAPEVFAAGLVAVCIVAFYVCMYRPWALHRMAWRRNVHEHGRAGDPGANWANAVGV